MNTGNTDKSTRSSSNRRDFLKKSFAAAAASIPLSAETAAAQSTDQPSDASANRKPPNVVVIIADQFRGDFIGANGQNPMGVTPNLDAMAERGGTFTLETASSPDRERVTITVATTGPCTPAARRHRSRTWR